MYQPSMKARMAELEREKAGLEARLAGAEEPPPLLHPNLAEVFRQQIGALHERSCGLLGIPLRSGT